MGLGYWLQSKIATIVGDTWISSKCVAIWPWPATVIGIPEHKATGADYRAFTSLLEPGDMLLTTSYIYKGSNGGIPGFFSHLIFYAGPIKGTLDDDHFIRSPKSLLDLKEQPRSARGMDCHPSQGYFKRSVIHAISEGVRCQDLFDIWQHYDYIAAIRISDDPEVRKKAIKQVLSEVGKDYDFSPSSSDLCRYCTEIGAAACKAAGVELPEQVPFIGNMWKPWKKTQIYVADKYIKKFKVVCTTKSCNDPRLYRIATDPDIIRSKMAEAPDVTKL